MGKIGDFMAVYRRVNLYLRTPWVNIKWRALVFLLIVVFVYGSWLYIDEKYAASVCGVEQFACNNTVFYWFMVGMISGIVFIMLAFEGEMVIAVWKQMKKFKAEQLLRPRPAPRARPKPALKEEEPPLYVSKKDRRRR